MVDNQAFNSQPPPMYEASLDELEAQQAALSRLIDQKKKEERNKVIAEMLQQMERYGITASDLASGVKRVRAPAPAKYRNQATGETWTGRGRAPNWLEGLNKEDFLIV